MALELCPYRKMKWTIITRNLNQAVKTPPPLKRHRLWLLILAIFYLTNVAAANHTVNLVVAYKNVNFAGKIKQAIAVNNQIPAPTLHFKEGDHVTINVFNHLQRGTAIHWHGVLVPWQMDGVEGVTQKAIPPGGFFQYRFTLHQSGTYWYHAHAAVQEQQGLYGAFLIDPPQPPNYHYTKDFVIVLSDWSNTHPDDIVAQLKKDGDYFAPKFRLQPSLVRFISDYQQARISNERQQVLNDYQMMQQMRMSIYDISDVAYDAFLLNGHSNINPWSALVKTGDTVRLRFIGAGGSTIFRVKIFDSLMQMVHVQGNDVKPYLTSSFNIAPGETYDVLVKIKKNSPYIIYAESLDTIGAAVGALTTSPNQKINYRIVPKFPEPPPVTREMMANMMNADMQHSAMNMHMSSHSMVHTMHMPTEASTIGDILIPTNQNLLKVKTTGTSYQALTAKVKTNDPLKTVNKIIKMELFGYMNHFIWMINGLPEYKTKPILIEANQRYRIIFTNNSMMRHPMHIHGHWFILRNGHGAYDPLLHTIEVPPGATAIADFDTDASGQWFFHCHHLYHMMSGMARVLQYQTIIEIAQGKTNPASYTAKQSYANRPIIREDESLAIDSSLINHPMAHPPSWYYSNYLDVGEDPFSNAQRISFKGLYGSDYHKLELFSNDAEISKSKIENADLDIFYWHLISQFWMIKGGVNYTYRPSKTPYWQPGIGIEGLMPYFIDTNIRAYYHRGSIKLDADLSRDTQITNNFFIRLGIRSILATKTLTADEVGSGLNQMRYMVRPYYRLLPGLNIFAEYEHEQDYGLFKNIRRHEKEQTSEDTATLGLAVLF